MQIIFIITLIFLVFLIFLEAKKCNYLSPSKKWSRYLKTPYPKVNVYKNYEIAIIGGGISGMTMIKNIKDTNAKITLYEKTSRLGGNNYSSNSHPRIPMRFAAVLTNKSPNIENLCHDLGLKLLVLSRESAHIKINNKIVTVESPLSKIKYFTSVYLPTLYKYYFSRIMMNEAVCTYIPSHDHIFTNALIPVAGLNLFANNEDWCKLPSDQVAKYILEAFPGTFSCIENGNHRLINKLKEKIKNKYILQGKANSIKVVNDGIIINDKKYQSIVLCCQPHDARCIIPKDLQPHYDIVSCFDKVYSYSCLHSFTSLFNNISQKKMLYYEVIENNHYLHIDAAFYKLVAPRQLFITVHYDRAPKIIPKQYIVEESYTTLSRVRPTEREHLVNLLTKLIEQ